ncbi:hypothetical protein ACPV5W_00900 [Vibrio astriarenae]
MKMIFVDAENVGLKELQSLKASLVDKVFVFSKSDAIKHCCDRSLYYYLSDYPNGQNQADFYIIAHQSRLLCMLDKKQLGSVNFELYSNDASLISAFESQCSQFGAISRVVRTKEQMMVSPKQAKRQSPEERIYEALKTPTALDPNFQKKMGLSKQAFSRAIHDLFTSNRIQRSKKAKKKWVQCHG